MLSERQRRTQAAWQAAHPFRWVWFQARARAKTLGRTFTITEDDVRAAWPADGRCPVLGLLMAAPGIVRGTRKRGPKRDSPSLDRIDNSRGYEPDNIAFISWRANQLKRAASAEEIAALARWLTLRSLL